MADSPINSREITLDELRTLVAERKGQAYAVLDACNQPLVLEKAAAVGDQAVCLYGGQARQDFHAIAPYLFALNNRLLQWIVVKLWEKPWWGIILFAPVGLDDLRQHLLRFLKVRGPNDESWYFRFYDPRVLPTYLETCTPAESANFFGSVDWFVVNSASGRVIILERGGSRV